MASGEFTLPSWVWVALLISTPPAEIRWQLEILSEIPSFSLTSPPHPAPHFPSYLLILSPIFNLLLIPEDSCFSCISQSIYIYIYMISASLEVAQQLVF